MRIGIFPVMAGRDTTGPDAYETNLVRHLAAVDSDNDYHLFGLSEAAGAAFGVTRENFRYHLLRPSQRWISIPVSLPIALMHHRVELMHATFVPPPVSPVGYVFTHHCFSTFAHPEFYDPAVLLRLNKLIITGLRRARRIICVSNNVRDLTKEKFGIPEERMDVVYNGVSASFQPVPEDECTRLLRDRFGIDYPYVLFTGSLQKRKNISRILEAFAAFRAETRSELRLVMVGKPDQAAGDYDRLTIELGISDYVTKIGHVAYERLPPLYSGATLFLWPSLWEGFGLPVLEAMACGTPVITSNLSSLPEVSGGAARLVDPYSVEEIAASLCELYNDSECRAEMRARGLRRAAEFSWTRCARETRAVYERCMSS